MGTWIEMSLEFNILRTIHSRSLRGNVDRNFVGTVGAVVKNGRSLRGNVDRNSRRLHDLIARQHVVPYVGTWIEMATLS